MTQEAPAVRTRKTTEYLKYEFTPEELEQCSQAMARAVERRATVEQRKKEVTEQLKSEVSREDGIINDNASRINKGYEFRNVECEIRFNVPESGMKTITRLDTGEVVRTEKMDAFEMQEMLALDPDDEGDDDESGAPVPWYGQSGELYHICTANDTNDPDRAMARTTLCDGSIIAQIREKLPRGATLCPDCKKAAKEMGL